MSLLSSRFSYLPDWYLYSRGPTTPRFKESGFGLFRFRSPLLSESRLIYFPPGTEMVHFPGFARTRLWIQRAVSRVYRDGFPHSEIPGSKLACSSPRLFAACHVLHRLLAPRHPPYALSSLTIKLTQHVNPADILTNAGACFVLRKLAFPQIAPPAISPVRTLISKCARRGSGGLLEQNLQLSDSQTSDT